MYNMTLKLGVFLANDLSRVHQPEGLHVTVVIDVFRASSTAAYVLEGKPKTYILTSKCEVIARLAKILNDPVIIGKSELDKNMVSLSLVYDSTSKPFFIFFPEFL